MSLGSNQDIYIYGKETKMGVGTLSIRAKMMRRDLMILIDIQRKASTEGLGHKRHLFTRTIK